MTRRWLDICAMVSGASLKGNGFAYYTGDTGWMLGCGGDMDDLWDYQLTKIVFRT